MGSLTLLTCTRHTKTDRQSLTGRLLAGEEDVEMESDGAAAATQVEGPSLAEAPGDGSFGGPANRERPTTHNCTVNNGRGAVLAHPFSAYVRGYTH
jgi:hypothetical protein